MAVPPTGSDPDVAMATPGVFSLRTDSVRKPSPPLLVNSKTNRYQPSVVTICVPEHEPGELLPKLMAKAGPDTGQAVMTLSMPKPPAWLLSSTSSSTSELGAVPVPTVVGDRYRSSVTGKPLAGNTFPTPWEAPVPTNENGPVPCSVPVPGHPTPWFWSVSPETSAIQPPMSALVDGA